MTTVWYFSSKNQIINQGSKAENSISTNFNSNNNLVNNSQIQSLPAISSGENQDILVVQDCNLSLKFDKNYGIKNQEKGSLTLVKKPIENNISEFMFTVNCNSDQNYFNSTKNDKQENSKFYNKTKIDKMEFVPNYSGEIYRQRNNSGTGLAQMSENYIFIYGQKTYEIGFITAGQNLQEKVNYDAQNLISPLFPDNKFEIQFN